MAADNFAIAFAAVVGVEGGYTNNASDPGNWTGGKVGSGQLRGTKYGISAASFPTLDIPNLTLDQARAIYLASYFVPIAGSALPPAVALVTFDCAVNQGVGIAQRILQASVDVDQDGAIGPVTLSAVARFGNQVANLVNEICARRAVRYAQGNMATFGLGWMRRLFAIRTTAEIGSAA